MAKLVVFRGDAVAQEVRLSGSTVRIGRHHSNDVVLDDSSSGVSRFHAEVRAEDGAYVIVDLNSRNGLWIDGRRVQEQAALSLGVPVTIGAFELALEDEVSTGYFTTPVVNQPTEVSAPPLESDHRQEFSASRARSPSAESRFTTTHRQILLWSGAAAAVLLICGVTFIVARSMSRPAPIAAAVEPPSALPVEPPPLAPAPQETDATKALIEQHLAGARAQMEAGDYTSAVREHLQLVLELEPENARALEWKRQADAAIAAAAAQEKIPKVVLPPAPSEVETPDIRRKPGEVWPDYTARVKRVQIELADGKSNLDRQEFAAALVHFRAAERDQPGYPGLDRLIAETVGKQQKALEEAMNGGQQNERAGKLREARLWYRRAMEIDPASVGAREKNQSLLGRMTAEASKLFDGATFAVKSHDTAVAIRQFQQILDLMLPGDEIRERAARQLEALKR